MVKAAGKKETIYLMAAREQIGTKWEGVSRVQYVLQR